MHKLFYLFFLFPLSVLAQSNLPFQGFDVHIKPYCSDYLMTSETLPDSSWTVHPLLQVQFIETIPREFINQRDTLSPYVNQLYRKSLYGVLIFPSVTIDYHEKFPIYSFEYASSPKWKISEQWKDYARIRYSYASIFNLGMNRYLSPTYFMQADELSYFFARGRGDDKLRLSIDVPDFLFYFRSDKEFERDTIDSDLRRITTTVAEAPSLFIMYKPGFWHEQDTIADIPVDLLWERVDTEHYANADSCKLVYLPDDKKESVTTGIERLRQVIPMITKTTALLGKSPSKIEFIVSNMEQKRYELKYIFAFSRRSPAGKGLISISPEDFKQTELVHEIMHLYTPKIADSVSWLTPYERFLLSEALVEYLASYIDEVTTSSKSFIEKEKRIEDKGYTSTLASKVSKFKQNITAEKTEESSNWLYYTYVPYQIHKTAIKCFGGDEKMVQRVVEFLKQCEDQKWEEKQLRPQLDKFKKELGVVL